MYLIEEIHALIASSSTSEVTAPTARRAAEIAGRETSEATHCLPVEVPDDCMLSSKYGLKYLIYCLPPNLNPARPNCIVGPEATAIAAAQLEKTYDNLFSLCVSLSQTMR